MSSVVVARECLLWPCASFTSAPAIFNQTAREVLRLRQFTQFNPNFRAAGLMKRVRMLLSRIGLPSLTVCNLRSFGPSDLTARYLRMAASPYFDCQDSQTLDPLDNTQVYTDCGV